MTDVSADLPRRLASKAIGTMFLLAAVVGSGIMGERLAGGNVAVVLMTRGGSPTTPHSVN